MGDIQLWLQQIRKDKPSMNTGSIITIFNIYTTRDWATDKFKRIKNQR